jgi:hypothetical protein
MEAGTCRPRALSFSQLSQSLSVNSVSLCSLCHFGSSRFWTEKQNIPSRPSAAEGLKAPFAEVYAEQASRSTGGLTPATAA